MQPNPFDELERFFERMESQFDASVDLDGGAVAVDVLDADEEYLVTADLPGFAVEDLDLTFNDGRLRITGSRAVADEIESERYLRRERTTTSVDRRIRIPEPIEAEAIDASFDAGVLTITLPKVEEDEGTEIEIE